MRRRLPKSADETVKVLSAVHVFLTEYNEWAGGERLDNVDSLIIQRNAAKFFDKLGESQSQDQFDPCVKRELSFLTTRGANANCRSVYRFLCAERRVGSHEIPDDSLTILSTAFKTAFRGHGATALLEHLTEAERKFITSDPGLYYGRFFSFTQASGTGKTRTMMEVSSMAFRTASVCLI